MTVDADVEKLKEKRLCFDCVGDSFLSEEIKKHRARARCDYCGKMHRCSALSEIAERVEQAFEEFYVRTSDQPDSWQSSLLADRESNYEWQREGESVIDAITNAANIPEDAARDIQQILEEKHFDFDAAKCGDESEFAAEACYTEKGPDDSRWHEAWQNFEHSLKTEARFFSRSATTHLDSVFEGLKSLRTYRGKSCIVAGGPNTELTELYRARVFQSDGQLKEALARPDLHLGPPPVRLANAGRMNARGISVFYGANSPDAALGEVRPPVGSQVATARFEILRPIQLLDFSILADVVSHGSVFDSAHAQRLARVSFLRSLSRRLIRPVMPDDEAFEYLTTQAVADYLATETKPSLDGIIFPSVQVAGEALNVVLFHKAARVQPLEFPEGTEIDVRLGEWSEDGWETDYTVIEEMPPKAEQTETSTTRDIDPFALPAGFQSGTRWEEDYDLREPTMRIDTNSIDVHIIRAVKFEVKDHHVSRYRWEKTKSPDF